MHALGGRYGHLESLIIIAIILSLCAITVLACWKKNKLGAPWADSDGFRPTRNSFPTFRLSNLTEIVQMKGEIERLREELMQARADTVFLEDRIKTLESRLPKKSGLLTYGEAEKNEARKRVSEMHREVEPLPLPSTHTK